MPVPQRHVSRGGHEVVHARGEGKGDPSENNSPHDGQRGTIVFLGKFRSLSSWSDLVDPISVCKKF
jgi:hypothetical protein